MNIQSIKSTNIGLTEAIKNYCLKRLGELDRLLSNFGQPQDARVEIGKITNHHKKGNIFRFEINLKVPGRFFALNMNLMIYINQLIQGKMKWRDRYGN